MRKKQKPKEAKQLSLGHTAQQQTRNTNPEQADYTATILSEVDCHTGNLVDTQELGRGTDFLQLRFSRGPGWTWALVGYAAFLCHPPPPQLKMHGEPGLWRPWQHPSQVCSLKMRNPLLHLPLPLPNHMGQPKPTSHLASCHTTLN